ncbi:MAG TPA: hypothetical protein VF168_10880 [Trueperaceae bacterium]
MSFDLLTTILFILLFVVGPLLQRRGQRRRPPGGGADRPQAGPPTPRTDAGTEGPLSKRLEEARRRVLEAMGEDTGEATRPAPRQQPRQPELDWQGRVDWQKDQQVDWQQKGVSWQEVVTPEQTFIAAPPKRSSLRSDTGEVISAPPLRTMRRRRSRPTARLAVGRGFGLTPDAILSGIIWHEILGEPVSKRGIRRGQSRHRSR